MPALGLATRFSAARCPVDLALVDVVLVGAVLVGAIPPSGLMTYRRGTHRS